MKMGLLSALTCLTFWGLSGGAVIQADTISHGNPAVSLSIDFVEVQNAGSGNDTTGYGGVDYNYRIGKYEISGSQWNAAANASDADQLFASSKWGADQPVAEISWHEAAMFCNWLTSGDATKGAYTIGSVNDIPGFVTDIDRSNAIALYGKVYVLPTENEWYKAAYYDPHKNGAGLGGYWSDPLQANSSSPADGIDSKGDTVFDAVFNEGFDQGAPNVITNVGAENAYGTVGQGGSVWEWSESSYSPTTKVLRGGSWASHYEELLATTRRSNQPENRFQNIGLRVASVPEPSGLLLAACGGIGLLARRRRSRRF